MSTTMNISLTVGLKKKVADLVEFGNFSTPSDYVRYLIRKDLEAKEEDLHLRELLIEGLNSPLSTKSHDEIFNVLEESIENHK